MNLVIHEHIFYQIGPFGTQKNPGYNEQKLSIFRYLIMTDLKIRSLESNLLLVIVYRFDDMK